MRVLLALAGPACCLFLAASLAHTEDSSDRMAVVGGPKMGAVDLSTGQWAWKRNGWGEAWTGAPGPNAVAWLAPEQGGLECVELETGASKWRLEGSPLGLPAGPTRWIAREGRTLSAVSLQTGETVWKTTLDADIDDVRPPAIAADDDAVFVHVREGLVALEMKDGAVRWEREGRGFERLKLVHGGLYACAKYAGTPAYVRRIDRATGKEYWRCEIQTDLEPAAAFAWGAPTITLVSSAPWGDSGWTHALDAATGKVCWSSDRTTVGVWADAGGARAWIASPPDLRVVDTASGEGSAIDSLERDGAAFLLDGNRMLVADWERGSCGVGLRAYDAATCEKLWTAIVQGIEVPHSEYWHRVRLERIGPRLVLIGESAGGSYVNVIDPATGTVTLSNALK